MEGQCFPSIYSNYYLKGETQMKKMFFTTAILIIALSMVSCSNDSTTETTAYDDIPTHTFFAPDEKDVIVSEFPELSEDFIHTALQFIDEYSTPSNDFGNLATKAILQSNELMDKVYAYLNYQLIETHGEEIRQFFGDDASGEVHDVNTWVHNYEVGGTMYCVSFNGGPAVISNNNPLFISAGVLGNTYPDNIALAEARIASYVLLHMDANEVNYCIRLTSEGKEFYDFTFKNEAFKEAAKEVLLNLLEG